MVSHYRCTHERRLQIARTQRGVNGQYVNGIDYLEVAADQKTLLVHLLHDLSPSNPLTPDNVHITSGIGSKVAIASVNGQGQLLAIRLQDNDDRSLSYTLQLVKSPLQLAQRRILNLDGSLPPDGFDVQLSRIQFSLQTTENREFDCKTLASLPSEQPAPSPVIDYLAKDYASFRQLMLDRLTLTMPAAKERSPADIMVMLVEVLAYAADHLSYYQDAVATEAYLGTARRRMSVRRHARLLDYFMHDGCNARTWVVLEVEPALDGHKLSGSKPDGVALRFLTRLDESLLAKLALKNQKDFQSALNHQTSSNPVLSYTRIDPADQDTMNQALYSEAQVFESLDDITLYSAFNEISFYTWGEEDYVLAFGATQATLKDTGGHLKQHLKAGMVLIVEENLNPNTGRNEALDLTHRHAVRLLKVISREDPLVPEEGSSEDDEPKQQQLVEIEWYPEDALPFQLWVSKRINGKLYPNLAIAHGNVVLVDHGYTHSNLNLVVNNNLEAAKKKANHNAKFLDANTLNQVPDSKRYRPYLENTLPTIHQGPLTHQRYVPNPQGQWVLVDRGKSAREALGWLSQDFYPNLAAKEYNVNSTLSAKEYKAEELAREALDQKRRFIKPCITLKEYNTQEFSWDYQPDLLNSDRFDRHFVVETEEDGVAYLRFGDDALGKRPEAGTYFQVSYRTGNGSTGNIGADAIAHVVTDLKGIRSVRNPLPAQGGIDPETLDQVRLYAPQAYREISQRAVTEDDYARIAERFPDVQRAVATRRWTGSWYTIFLTVDRQGGRPLDDQFKAELRTFLDSFRMAGHDVEIEEPRFVPLDIAMQIHVASTPYDSIKQTLQEVFSNRVLSDGRLGFFHPDRLSFGQPLYLSQIVDTAMQVKGVQSVDITRFQRWGKPPAGELEASQVSFGSLEIAQLNNDPATPSQGRIEFEMKVGYE